MDTLAEAASSFIDFSSTTVGAPNRRGDMGGRRWGKGMRDESTIKNVVLRQKTHVEMGRERDRRSITDKLLTWLLKVDRLTSRSNCLT